MDLLNEFKNYLFSQKDLPAKVTVKNYLSDINHFIRWYEKEFNNSFNPTLVSYQTITHYKLSNTNSFSQSSMERHLSSLRKFFKFLILEGKISANPFVSPLTSSEAKETDPWHLKDFKNYLYVYNASHLTIKNYIIDIRQFLSWAESVTNSNEIWNTKDRNILGKINNNLLEEYKNRLISEGNFSPTTVNRKLSSLRKYLGWAEEENYVSNINSSFPNINQGTTSTKVELKKLFSPAAATIAEAKSETKIPIYSKFPPIRLAQKLSKIGIYAFDQFLTFPFMKGAEKISYLTWLAKGKPVFTKIKSSKAKIFQSKAPIITHNPLRITNVKKQFYAPLEMSTAYFPWYKKTWFMLRYRRPNWYKAYHSYPITHYFHFAILIIFMAVIGFGFYQSFFQKPQASNPALAAIPSAPLRILSFQGRLTDNQDNPISTPSALRFAIYNAQAPATGSALLWQEVDAVSPDQDGIFSVLLGNAGMCPVNQTNPTGPCGIPNWLFASNSALFLGVSVNTTPEMTPRQQLATVAYAANSETLQGLLPITGAGAGQTNVVLALDSSGNLTIGGSANPTFQASGGQFTISGQPVLITTNTGSNANVTLSADGLGKIAINKPLISTSNSNNISTAVGSVEVDSLFSVLATSSGQSAVTINQTGGGPLISASQSGTAKFTVDGLGNTTIAGGAVYSVGTSTGLSLTNACVNTTGGIVTGTGTCPTQTGTNWWNQLAGALSPVNTTNDFLLGSTATSSALFSFTGIKTGQTIASASGNLIVMANNGYGGMVGIGTNAPVGVLDVSGPPGGNSWIYLRGNANGVVNPSTSVNYGLMTAWNSSGGNGETQILYGTGLGATPRLDFGRWSGATKTIDMTLNGGNVGIGTTSPTATLDVAGAASVGGQLTFRSGTAQIQSTANQGLTLGGNTTGNITLSPLNGAVGGNVVPSINQQTDLGTSGLQWRNIYAQNFIGGTTGIQGLWQRTSGSLAPTNITDSLNLGAVATGSALVHLAGTAGENSFINTGNVGIGTTTPTVKLQVAGANVTTKVTDTGTGFTYTQYGNATSGLFVGTENTSGGGVFSGSTANAGFVGTNGTAPLQFGVNAAIKATLDQNGNLGIGTTSPVSKLHMHGDYNNTGAGGFALDATDNGNPETYILRINPFVVGAAMVGYQFQTKSATGGTNVPLTFDNAGKVGIGTIAPTALLDVAGAASVGGQLTFRSGTAQVQSTANQSLTLGGNTTGNITLAPLNGAVGGNVVPSVNQQTDLGTSALQWRNIYAQNFIGGTTGIQGLWQRTLGSLAPTNVTDSLNLGATATSSALVHLAGTAGENSFINTGNVGIGTTGPNYKLDVAGAGNFTSTASNVNALTLTATAGMTSSLDFYRNGYANWYLGSANNSTSFNIGGDQSFATAVISINQSNNVGIGTTTPGTKLDISGTTQSTVFNVVDANAIIFRNNNNLQIQAFAGNQIIATSSGALNLNSLTGVNVNAMNGGPINLLTSVGGDAGLTSRLYITNGGNIGIGTTAPTSGRLQVDATTNPINAAYLNGGWNGTAVLNIARNNGQAAAAIYLDSGSATYPNAIDNNSDFAIKIGGSEKIRIQAGGNVGIGTTTPTALLDVAGTASVGGQLTFRSGTAQIQSTARQTLSLGGTTTGIINVLNSAGSAFTTFDTVNSRIGIGTTNPESPLHIPAATYHSSFGISGNVMLGQTGVTNGNNKLMIVSNTGSTCCGGWIGFDDTSNTNLFVMQVSGGGSKLGFSVNGGSTLANMEMLLDTTGNLGIGTTSPISELHVTRPLSFGVTGKALAIFDQIENQDIFTASASGTTRLTLSNGGNLNLIGGVYQSGGTSGVSISNACVNTTGGIVTGTGTCPTQTGTNWWNQLAGALSPVNTTNDFLLGSTATSSALFSFTGIKTGQTIASASGNLIVMPNNGWGGNAAIGYNSPGTATLAVNGNVGIGTTGPGTKLHVVDASDPRLRLTRTGTANFDLTVTSGGLGVIDLTGAGNNIVINSSGNVGIGTTLPGAKLDVAGGRIIQAGSATITGYLETNSGMLASTTGVNPGILVFGGDATNSVYGMDLGYNNSRYRTRLFTSSTGTDISFGHMNGNTNPTAQSNFTELMTIRGDGNVGIGTTGPANKLTVVSAAGGATSNYAVRWDNTNGVLGYLGADPSSYNSGAIHLYQNFGANSVISANGSSYLMGGNVGIGTTSPTAPLHINTGYANNAALIVNNLNSGDLFVASASGATKFEVTNAGFLLPGTTNTQDIGSTSLQWRNIYGQNIYQNGILMSQYWQRNLGALSPLNITDDLLIGATATTTAQFSVSNIAKNQAIASLSGNLIVMANNGWGGNVGIGTINPNSNLEVYGTKITGANKDFISISSIGHGGSVGDAASLAFTNGTTTVGRVQSVVSAGSYDLAFHTGGTIGEKMRIMANGYVGIGNSNPQNMLDVSGAIRTPAGSGGGIYFGGANTVIQGDSNRTFTFFGNGTGTLSIQANESGTGNSIFTTTSTGNIVLASDFDSGVLVGSSSNTKAPLSISGGIGSNASLIVNQLNSGDIIAASASGATQFRVTNAGVAYARSFYDLDNSTYFLDPGATGTSLRTAGSVCITCTILNPNVGLQVGSGNTASFSGSLVVYNNSGSFDWLDGADIAFRTSVGGDTGATTKMTIKNGGNVGIGTTNPTLGKLSVNGVIHGYGGNGGLGEINLDNGASASRLQIRNETGGWVLKSVDTSDLQIFVNNTLGRGITIKDTTGNVGIGTTSPATTLAVVGSKDALSGVGNPANYLEYVRNNSTTNGQGAGIAFAGSTTDTDVGAAIIFKRTGGESQGELQFYTKQNTSAGGNPTQAMVIDNVGNVGIGTGSPLSQLHVSGGTSGGRSTLIVDQLGASTNNILTASSSGTTQLYLTNGGALYTRSLYDIDNANYFLDPAATTTSLQTVGSIVVGTTSPLAKTGFYMDIASLGNTLMVINQQSSGDLIAASSSGTTRFLVKNNGDTVIGNAGTGKLTATTLDPLYTIDGTRYSTYAPSMVGVKEEVTGKATLTYNQNQQSYSYTINLNSQEQGSDLWLFSRVTDPDINLLTALLTPDSSAKVWYDKNVAARSITFFSDRPTNLSYRLSAPRFDHNQWANLSNETTPEITGLIAPPAPNTSTLSAILKEATMSGQIIGPDNSFTVGQTLINGVLAYNLSDSFGNVIRKIDNFSNLLVANLQTGAVLAREIASDMLNTNYLTVRSKLISPIAEVDIVRTNLISPIGNDAKIALKLEDNKLSILNGNSASASAVTSFDNQGNATFSGSLTADEASISGTLRAGKIIASEIEGLNIQASTVSANYITNNYYTSSASGNLASNQLASGSANYTLATNGYIDISSYSGLLANIDKLNAQSALIQNLSVDKATFTQGLMAFGPSSFAEVSVADQLSVGGNLILANGAINALGSDLQLQPLKQGGLSIMAGLFYIDTSGNVKVSGNAEFAKDVTVGGKLSANVISPIPGNNLTLNTGNSNLEVRNASNAATLSLNNLGDIIASGSGTFGKLNLSLIEPAYALSSTEIVATGSAGTAAVRAYYTEVTIDNPLVTEKSLIYLTPKTNQQVYLMRQVPGVSFTVGVQSPSVFEIPFNWIIVN